MHSTCRRRSLSKQAGLPTGLPVIYERAAVIDIGACIHVVGVAPELCDQPVQVFQAFTGDIEPTPLYSLNTNDRQKRHLLHCPPFASSVRTSRTPGRIEKLPDPAFDRQFWSQLYQARPFVQVPCVNLLDDHHPKKPLHKPSS